MRALWRAEFAAGALLASALAAAALGAGQRPWVVAALLAAALGALASRYVSVRRALARRSREEGARAERDSLFRAIVEGTTDAVFVKDMDGRYTMINAAGARMLGRTPAEVVGRTDADLMPPE